MDVDAGVGVCVNIVEKDEFIIRKRDKEAEGDGGGSGKQPRLDPWEHPKLEYADYLPSNAWAEWGKGAVYFATGDLETLSIFAVNPTGEGPGFPEVYSVGRLPLPRSYHCPYFPACAVIDSKIYVLGGIHRGAFGWNHVAVFDLIHLQGSWAPPMQSGKPYPLAFTLRGKLYALSLYMSSETGTWLNDPFEVLDPLAKDSAWIPLEPPSFCRHYEYTLSFSMTVVGHACVNDSTLILHAIAYDGSGSPWERDYFFRFQAEDVVTKGFWSQFKVYGHSLPLPPSPAPGPIYGTCSIGTYCAYLGDDDIPLLLPTASGKLLAYRRLGYPKLIPDAANARPNSERCYPGNVFYEEVLMDPDTIFAKLVRDLPRRDTPVITWNIIHLGDWRFCLLFFYSVEKGIDNRLEGLACQFVLWRREEGANEGVLCAKELSFRFLGFRGVEYGHYALSCCRAGVCSGTS